MLLRWLDRTTLPVESDHLRPDLLLALSPADVARLPAHVGNQPATLGDLFAIDSDNSDSLLIEGDLRHVLNLGRRMASGSLIIEGRAGDALGSEMTGGSIEVRGDAGHDAGLAMRGGTLRIRGNAGHGLGGSSPGALLGMRDGLILVHGSAGNDAGRRMRRGLIAVAGDLGDLAGHRMVAGSLFSLGRLGRAAGMGMKRGTIATFAAEPPDLGPAFTPSGRHRFPFLALYLRQLLSWDFPVPPAILSAPVARYNGDLTNRGRGEILVLADPSGA